MIGKKIRGLLIATFLCAGVLAINTNVVYASESDSVMIEDLATDTIVNETEEERTFTGENLYSNSDITGMDENGNVYEWIEETPDIEGVNPYSRTTEPLLVDFHTKDSYTVTYYTEYKTGRSGYTNGAYGADAVYLGLVDGQVKFMLAGVTGLVDLADVRLINFSEVGSYSYYGVNSSGRLIHYITTDVSGTSYASKLDNGPAPSYLASGVKYLSYDGHYFYTSDQYAVMQSDCNEGHRNNAINAENPYYNYYQFLPFRSTSDYSAADLQEAIHSFTSSTSKMNNLGDTFITYQNKYGINALLAASIAANESAWGSSRICQTKNNLFGINAVDSAPGTSANTFSSPAACVKTYVETYLSNRYCRPGYTYYNGAFLGNKASGANVKYASDPYWGEKAAAIAWKLDNVNGGVDSYKYTIGIKNMISTDHTNVNVRNKATTSSTVVHQTGNQSDQAFLIMDKEPVDGFYKIQSPGVLNAARTEINSSTGVYSDFQMYLYISADYVTVVSEAKASHTVEYNTHVSNLGWQPTVTDGQFAGTTGKALPVEAISIRIDEIEGLGVTYRTHVRNVGWQTPVSDGEIAGTTGKALSIEAIEISLTGKKANQYDIYYSTHVANVGWLGWAKNGAPAGSSGYAYPIEAIKIKLVNKGAAAPGSTENAYMDKNANTVVTPPSVIYEAHVCNIGWMNPVKDGALAGTTGRALPLEALKINVDSEEDLRVSYSAHVRNIGWMSAVRDGSVAGTTGRVLSMEAIQISLSGSDANKYDIYYRTHVSNLGWLGWAKNGASAGSAGYAYPMEAIEICIVAKGSAAPGSTAKPFVQKNK